MAITEQELESVAKVMLRAGYARFRWNRGGFKPRLVDGIELVNARNDWAISLFRNVHNEANDVEIAIAVARLVEDSSRTGAAMKWLEAVRNQFQHGEHKPHHSSYKGEVFRIGLQQAEAQAFLEMVMSEVLRAPSKVPWDTSGIPAAAESVAAQTVDQVPVPSVPASERANAIAHMVTMALQARDQSGLERITTVKDKEVRFASASELRAYVESLWNSDYCVLSGLKLDLTGADPELEPSLDRIDSSKHYEPGNLQVVARFINRWKSDDDESNFVRLLNLVRDTRLRMFLNLG
jgi:hypothetical protein